MILQLFRPPGDGETLMECKLGDISDAVSFEFQRYFCGVGTFSLELPSDSLFGRKITANTLIYDPDYDECFVAKNIRDDSKLITVTGYDLGCLLRDRIVLGNSGAQVSDGHVCIAGTTEYCVKYFVQENLVSADDNNRNYPRLTVAPDLGRGLENAHGYAAPECVDDVIRALCENAGLGYSIRLDTAVTGSASPLFIFDVAEMSLRDGLPVVFSAGLGNVAEQVYEAGITAHKNALWCETGGEPVFVFEEEKQPVSWNRREEYVSVSVADETSGEEITEAARETMADKFAVTHSLTVNAGDPTAYGKAYFLGDYVSVYDKGRNAVVDTWISAVKVVRKAGEHTVALTMGDAKPKLLDGYAKQTDLLKRYQKNAAAEENTARYPVLKQYEVLSDTEIVYNGTTYTFTAGEGGEITEVSTDKGGYFAPTIPATLTDISAHNAAFMAVAMLSKLSGEPEPADPLTAMCKYRYNCDRMTQDGTTVYWHNQAGVEMDCLLYDAEIIDNHIRLYGRNTSYGYISNIALSSQGYTIYMVAQVIYHDSSCRVICIRSGVEMGGMNGYWTATRGINSSYTISEIPATQLCVLAASVYSDGTMRWWINGVEQTSPGTSGLFGSSEVNIRNTYGSYFDGSTVDYYDIAVSDGAHSADEVTDNIQLLMNKYGITGG